MSTKNIIPINPGKGAIVDGAGSAGIDNWGAIVEKARPTLDLIPKLDESRDWLAEWKTHDPGYYRLMLKQRFEDVAEAEARIALVPDMAFLQQAARLFDDAVKKAAPDEMFYHMALAAMLKRIANAASVDPTEYSFGVVDVILHDPEVRERDCEAGFSPPIFLSAIRKVRREKSGKFVPSEFEILDACQHYRKQFRELGNCVTILMQVRQNAEQVISENGWSAEDDADYLRQKAAGLFDGDNSDVPF